MNDPILWTSLKYRMKFLMNRKRHIIFTLRLRNHIGKENRWSNCLPIVFTRRFIERSDCVLRGWHAIAGCRRVASWDLVTGSHGTSGISSTAIVACSGVRSVRVPRIFRLNACHSVPWVRAHWSVTCSRTRNIYIYRNQKININYC